MTEILAGWAVFQVELMWVATCSAENATWVRLPQEEPLAGYLIGPFEIPTQWDWGIVSRASGEKTNGS
jgi:hypothetical protein